MWQCEHRASLSPVLVQLQTGNKGVWGSWNAEESWESQLSFLKKLGALLRSGTTRMVDSNTDGFVNFQVALLDFGATRGFDEKFTDVYIEVRTVS